MRDEMPLHQCLLESGIQLEHNMSHYVFGPEVGSGSFSVVYKARHVASGEDVAVKVISKASLSERAWKRLKRECVIMHQLQHPGCMPLRSVAHDAENVYLVMPYAKGGDLMDFLHIRGRLSEAETRIIFRQLAEAVLYAHGKGIIHRDLKLENVYLSENHKHALVGDWGFAGYWSPYKMIDDEFPGSIHFAPPEMWHAKPYIGPEVDTWSLGVLLFCIVCGRLPFCGRTDRETYKLIVSGQFRLSSSLSVHLKDLLCCLLTTDREKRPTLDALMSHPWISGCGSLSPLSRPSLPLPSQLFSALATSPPTTGLVPVSSLLCDSSPPAVILSPSQLCDSDEEERAKTSPSSPLGSPAKHVSSSAYSSSPTSTTTALIAAALISSPPCMHSATGMGGTSASSTTTTAVSAPCAITPPQSPYGRSRSTSPRRSTPSRSRSPSPVVPLRKSRRRSFIRAVLDTFSLSSARSKSKEPQQQREQESTTLEAIEEEDEEDSMIIV